MSDKEIEFKFQICPDEYARLLATFASKHCSMSEKRQIDLYFSPAGTSFYDKGDRCLRVRKEGNRAMLSYKRIVNDSTDGRYIEEYETEVADFTTTRRILEALGFSLEIIVDKLRREFSIPNGFLVSLDKVENLGCFIEVESAYDSESITSRNLSLSAYVEELGLNPMARNTEGYSNMLYKMSHNQG